jgi:uncharacterized protein (DUF885 family)
MPSAQDARFNELVRHHHEDRFRRRPSLATSLGWHAHDHQLEAFTLADAQEEAETLKAFCLDLEACDPTELALELAADRRWLLATTDGRLQELETFRPLETDPDHYSSGITDAAFTLINRRFAPAETRLQSLLARLVLMPAVLENARLNLRTPARARTEIALVQLPDNIQFFRETLVEAFTEVSDPELQRLLAIASERVATALEGYESFLRQDVLPRSSDTFAIGPDDYRRKLHADEMLTVPLARLAAIGEQDLARNQAAIRAAARLVDPKATLHEVLDRLSGTHVPEAELLATTQAMLPELVAFIKARDLLTVPPGPALRVVETPPFMRATVSAAMDSPGPFEQEGTEAHYYMTLPNPAWPPDEREAYMGQWNRPLIANLSAHEAYPGHYVQFLLTTDFPTLTRRVQYCPSNVEGWAHYCEQLMVEEGFHADDPWYQVAQLQDALLRNARVVVGLRMHTAGMTVAEAATYFEREAFLAAPVAKAEAWRGATDPTYGYYTLGKLMVLKLREDVRQARGEAFNLKAFHDEFLLLGPIPIPLARLAMLGETGEPLG